MDMNEKTKDKNPQEQIREWLLEAQNALSWVSVVNLENDNNTEIYRQAREIRNRLAALENYNNDRPTGDECHSLINKYGI